MFRIFSKYKIDSAIPIITHNYQVLHFDQVPILFSGTNSYGQNIISSLAAEDEQTGIYRYFVVIVSDEYYFKFIKKHISYKELLQKNARIFVVDKGIGNNIKNTYEVPIDQLPEKFLPLPSAYCPEQPFIFGSEFSVSLKGDLADKHEAKVGQVISISKHYEQLLTTIVDSTEAGQVLGASILQYVPERASFKITFKVIYNKTDLFIDGTLMNEYVTSLMKYSLNNLPSETEKLLNGETDDTDLKNVVENALVKTYEQLAVPYDENRKTRFKESLLKIPFELQKITDSLGDGFDYIQVSVGDSSDSDQKEEILGLINNDLSQKLHTSTEIILRNSDDSEIDDVYHQYTIRIYDLNTKTRKGSAVLQNSQNSEFFDSPHIRIEGKEDLSNTKYSESLHLSKNIPVSAKATKSKGKYRYLVVKFEF